MFLDTVLRQKMHNSWAVARQNQQNDLCAQRRLRSAWASSQSDHSLRCPHGETLGPLLPIKRIAKTLIRLCECPGRSESLLSAHDIYLVLSYGGSGCITTTTTTITTFATTERTAKTLIRLGWSQSLLSANVVLLVLSCGGSGCITTGATTTISTTTITTTTTTEQCLYNCYFYWVHRLS